MYSSLLLTTCFGFCETITKKYYSSGLYLDLFLIDFYYLIMAFHKSRNNVTINKLILLQLSHVLSFRDYV